MTLAVPRTATLLDEPHHDGSDLYVLERPEELGGEAVVRVRVPRGTAVGEVALRHVRDGEAREVPAELDEETESERWWRASFPVDNPATRYRWLLTGGDVGFAWLNGLGLVDHDVPDADDFVMTTAAGDGPAWHLGSVVYEIFPDRFAKGVSGSEPQAPSWAVPREWDEPPTGRGPETPFEWFGGDLRGIEQHLDHVERLGASLLYLTPIFPAGSTHRYDATSFDRIDPLLGGVDALASLLAAAHARGIRVLGDLTTNHCGDGHDWFRAARDDPDAPERELFYFDDSFTHGYACWWDIPTLPKLDWRSPELRRRMGGVARRWLDFGLDGWRIDVANMTGRLREIDVNAEAARTLREAVGDAPLISEHFHDFRGDLDGSGWNGTMNYSGFAKPVWYWLGNDVSVTGRQAVATMRRFRAGVPWPCVLHSWTLLDSHDVPRFRTTVGSRDRHVVGIGLQMTTPGVPMLFAGDELGLEGEWGEDARRTMPWDRPETWDRELFEAFRRLIALRRSSEALARGGIRYAHVGEDAIAYLRETPAERLLCLASRASHEPIRLPLGALGARALETLYGGDASTANGHAVLPAEGAAFHVWRLSDG
jgi:alpha-glucosidase